MALGRIDRQDHRAGVGPDLHYQAPTTGVLFCEAKAAQHDGVSRVSSEQGEVPIKVPAQGEVVQNLGLRKGCGLTIPTASVRRAMRTLSMAQFLSHRTFTRRFDGEGSVGPPETY